MTDLSPPLDEQILADLGWIRTLAVKLARDPELAEDLSQETCLLALAHRPRGGLRAWCATVTRNLLRQHHRGERRRQRREGDAARGEAIAPVDDLVMRAHAQRDLVQTVLALDEPYRATILLRFFEGLPPREIARRAGVPVTTVQSRITRALHLLRGRLDAQHGGRAWLAALLPLSVPNFVTPTVLAGTLVHTKAAAVGLFLTAALSVGAYVLWNQSHEPSGEDAGARAARAATDSGSGSGGSTSAGGSSAATAPLQRSRVPSAAPAPAAASGRTVAVRGRALHADGLRASNVGLATAAEPGREIARSRGDGTFEFSTKALPVRIVGADRGFVTLCAGAFDEGSDKEPLVVLAREVRFSGRVVDDDQRPLANAHLRVVLAPDWKSRNGLSLEATESQSWTARSDAHGRFVFAAAPCVPGSNVRTVLDGYESRLVQAPEQARDDVEIVLSRPSAPLATTLRGRVLTQEGDAGSEARVALGLTTTLADAKGFFELDLSRAVTADQLRAVKPGFQLGTLDRPAEHGPRGGWPEYIEVRLGPQALSIAGTVFDHEGKPMRDARVWLADGTPFGVLGHMPLSGEGLAAGATIPPQALETAARLPAQDGDNFNDYVVSKPPSNASWAFATTDGAGHFSLGGLAAREYTLKALDAATLRIQTSGPFVAGTTEAHIRFDIPDSFARYAARVVCKGQPMANVTVSLRCTPYDVRTRTFGGTVELRFDHPGGRTRTDQDGRFELRDVPKHGCHLILRGDDIVPQAHTIAPDGPGVDFDIEVDARYQVQVKLRPPLERADAIAAVDAQGQALDLLVLAAGSTNAYTDLPLHDGKSQVFALSSRAHQILLLKDGTPVDAIELTLQSGTINTVEG